MILKIVNNIIEGLPSLLLYTVIFGISLILCWTYEKNADKSTKLKKMIWLILIIMPPVLLSSFRYGIGIDYYSYVRQFNIVSQSRTIHPYFIQEPLNYFVLFLANILLKNVFGYFLIYSILIMIFVFKSIEYYKEKISITLALFIFYMTYFLVSFNIMRQMLAVVIILYGFRYVYEKKFWKYCICVIIATMFHKASIAMIILYIFNNNFEIPKLKTKIKNILYYFFIFITPVILIPLIKIVISFTGMFSSYLDLKPNVSVTFLLYIIPVIILILYKRKDLIIENEQNEFLIRLYVLQIPFNILGWFISFTNRFALYTGISQIILLPMVQAQTKEVKKKKIIIVLMILWYVFYFFVMYVILHSNDAFPYHSIFTKN